MAATIAVHSGGGSGSYGGSPGLATNFASNYNNPDLSLNVNWPSDSIDLSQLLKIFTQNPNFQQFNILFPNKINWSIDPASIRSLLGNYQSQAQNAGLTNRLPGLSFSSLASSGSLKSGILQLAVSQLGRGDFLSNSGRLENTLGDLLTQSRFQNLPLSDMLLPEWLKRVILEVCDAFYSAFQFLCDRLVAIFTHA